MWTDSLKMKDSRLTPLTYSLKANERRLDAFEESTHVFGQNRNNLTSADAKNTDKLTLVSL